MESLFNSWLLKQFLYDSSHQSMPYFQKPILFFDGVCGTCNRIVDFLLAADKKEQFLFAPLQGKTASQILDRKYIEPMHTMVYCDERGTWERSQAMIRLLSRLGGLWKGIKIFNLFPVSFLNIFYDWYAKYRYQILGKTKTCRLVSPAERHRFLE